MCVLVALGEFSAKPHANKQFGTSEEGVRNYKINLVMSRATSDRSMAIDALLSNDQDVKQAVSYLRNISQVIF